MKNYFYRPKVQRLKGQEMIKLIQHAEDVEEKHSIDNTKDVGHVDSPKLKWEDVYKKNKEI